MWVHSGGVHGISAPGGAPPTCRAPSTCLDTAGLCHQAAFMPAPNTGQALRWAGSGTWAEGFSPGLGGLAADHPRWDGEGCSGPCTTPVGAVHGV